jgi:uncharacterized membrane protein YfhO
MAPVGGWCWWLDGTEVALEQGPGIVQSLPVAAGRHELVGRYRPPGFSVAAMISLLAILAVTALSVKERREIPPPGAASATDPSFLR